MRVTYLGQACTLIEAGGKKILSDPWLTDGAYHGTWFHTHVLADAGVGPGSVPRDVDCLFLSHEHEDHLDSATLREFPRDVPIYICRFFTRKLRHHLDAMGFTNITELESGAPLDLGDGVRITIFGTAEYTNDSALLVEGDGCKVFNETDCKLGYDDLQRIGAMGIDLGFYMFSGANWYPIRYDYPEETKLDLVARRRRGLLKGLVQRVKLTKPKYAVPAAGPCLVLDPGLLWMNSERCGIFIDPEIAVRTLQDAGLAATPVYLTAGDVWDSDKGMEWNAPARLRVPREDYVRDASARYAATIQSWYAAEPSAGSDLGAHVVRYFEQAARAQTAEVRRRINAKIGVVATGPQAGEWTVDLTAPGPAFVRDGLAPDWTYKFEVEDKLLYPYVTGANPFFEHLFLSLRVKLARRPDEYNEPLYHFLYEPDPAKLSDWYAHH